MTIRWSNCVECVTAPERSSTPSLTSSDAVTLVRPHYKQKPLKMKGLNGRHAQSQYARGSGHQKMHSGLQWMGSLQACCFAL